METWIKVSPAGYHLEWDFPLSVKDIHWEGNRLFVWNRVLGESISAPEDRLGDDPEWVTVEQGGLGVRFPREFLPAK